jgi:hypothetical protein
MVSVKVLPVPRVLATWIVPPINSKRPVSTRTPPPASPALLLIAAGVKLSSRGPVFYTAERVGHLGRIFRFHKFRSMEVGSDEDPERRMLRLPALAPGAGLVRSQRPLRPHRQHPSIGEANDHWIQLGQVVVGDPLR